MHIAEMVFKLMLMFTQPSVDLVKYFEKYVPTPYNDGVGFMTIGYGHQIKNGEKFTKLSEQAAEELLKKDMIEHQNVINNLVKVPLEQHQHNALVSFVFNIGGSNFKKSPMLRYINRGELGIVPHKLSLYVYSGGKKLGGLERRRKAEIALWNGNLGKLSEY